MAENTVTIIDGEEEAPKNKAPVVISVVAIILAIAGGVFGFVQKSDKDKLNTRITNLESSVNIHVAEVEALKAQLEENGIKPNIVTSTETKTASNSNSSSSSSSNSSSSSSKSDSTSKTNDSSSKKETAGDGYSGYYVEIAGWDVKFEFPSGVKNLNYIPSDTSVSITSLTTDTKTYDSSTCASGFGQVVIGGSGTKLLTAGGKTYNYVAPSDSKCSGSDYEAAVSLTKKLFQGITTK